MSKPLDVDDDAQEPGEEASQSVSPGTKVTKNYMTPKGYALMRAELMQLIDVERPKIVEVVHWAASNGDRSENGDYIYGKRRLREIDRRIRFLTKRLDIALVVDPSVHAGSETVYFGATVTYCVQRSSGALEPEGADAENTVTILGVDEFDSLKGEVSWVSPVARALLGATVGDVVRLLTPTGTHKLEILEVVYPSPDSH